MSIHSRITSILELPAFYKLLSNLIGANRGSVIYVNEHIKPECGNKIIDIGCGPANILNFLGDIEYVGFDINPKYIESAEKNFGNRAKFFCERVSKDIKLDNNSFDIALATGILHHLSDDETIELFKLAKSLLKEGGRLITLDGCYIDNQLKVIKLILSNDRGKFVRTKDDYLKLAESHFDNVKVSIRSDILMIPYTHIIMECKK